MELSSVKVGGGRGTGSNIRARNDVIRRYLMLHVRNLVMTGMVILSRREEV